MVFECSGVPALANTALEQVKAGGTIVVLALYDDPVTFNPTVLVQKEIRLQGSIAYTARTSPRQWSSWQRQGQATPLITQRAGSTTSGRRSRSSFRRTARSRSLVTPNGG